MFNISPTLYPFGSTEVSLYTELDMLALRSSMDGQIPSERLKVGKVNIIDSSVSSRNTTIIATSATDKKIPFTRMLVGLSMTDKRKYCLAYACLGKGRYLIFEWYEFTIS